LKEKGKVSQSGQSLDERDGRTDENDAQDERTILSVVDMHLPEHNGGSELAEDRMCLGEGGEGCSVGDVGDDLEEDLGREGGEDGGLLSRDKRSLDSLRRKRERRGPVSIMPPRTQLLASSFVPIHTL
jgi:hypothetical protein